MIEMSATDAKNRFGELLELARKEPVRVQKSGRSAVVVADAEEYDSLVQRAAKPKVQPIVEKLLAESIQRHAALYEALAK